MLTTSQDVNSIIVNPHNIEGLGSLDQIEFQVPQIPEQVIWILVILVIHSLISFQSHDWELFLAVHNAATTQLESLPSTCKKVFYLSFQQAADLSQDEICSIFASQTIVVLPQPSGTQPKKSRFKDQNGRLTLANLTDPKTAVEVHGMRFYSRFHPYVLNLILCLDLSYSSLDLGQHQAVSRQSTVEEVIDHIYDKGGHVLNVLSLKDESKSLGQPEII